MMIKLSSDLEKELSKRKMYNEDTYEDIIWDLLEPTMEFSEETKRNIREAEKDIQEGRVITHEKLKKELGLQHDN